MRVVVVLLCLIHYVYGENCMVTPDANGHVSAADLSAELGVSNVLGYPTAEASSNPVQNSGFYECQALKTIEIPNTVETIGSYVFYNSGLTHLTIPSSVKTIRNDACWKCDDLESVNFSLATQLASIGDYAFLSADKLKSVDGLEATAVETIGKQAFDGTNLTSVTFPDNLHTIGMKAFSSTYMLKNITFLGDITTIESPSFEKGAFYKAGYDADTMSITFMGTVGTIEKYAFHYSGYYTDTMSITFMENVGTIAMNAFLSSGNRGKMSVEFQKDVTTISENAFKYSGMTSITYGGSKGSIDPSAFSNSAYEKCRLDETPPGMNLDTGHGTYNGTSSDTFQYCRLLTSVTILSNVTEIGSAAFYKATALTSVTIPSSVTEIGSAAFQDTTALTLVTIPDSVTTISSSAFKDSGLTSATVSVCTMIDSTAFPITTNLVKFFSQNCLDAYLAEGITYDEILNSFSLQQLKDNDRVARVCLENYVSEEGVTYDEILNSFTPEELKAAYRAKGNCPT